MLVFFLIVAAVVLYISWIILITGVVCTFVGAASSIVILWNMITVGYSNALLLYLLLALGVTAIGVFCLKLVFTKKKEKHTSEID